MFTGTIRVKICEASGLRPTDFQTRHKLSKPDDQPIDPYISIDIDDNHLDRSTTKPKTFDPIWNEYFVHDVVNASTLCFTVFHDAAIPPDDFVANCNISIEDLMSREKDAGDFWVSILYFCHFYTSLSRHPPRTSPFPIQVSAVEIRTRSYLTILFDFLIKSHNYFQLLTIFTPKINTLIN